jgi:hypothetical protein
MKRIGDTSDEATLLAKGALLELFDRFPKLREQSAIGGGIAVSEWVGQPPGMGPLNTADVDVVLDIHVESDHPRLRKELLDSGMYEPRRDKKDPAKIIKFSFWRKGPAAQRVQIDFQGPENVGTHIARGKEHLKDIGDLSARVLVGGHLALSNSEMRRIVGRTLTGERREGEVKLVKPFILVPLKAIAFRNRGLPNVDPDYRTVKDAADLYALLRFLGPETLARAAHGYRRRSLFEDALDVLKGHFGKIEGQGGEGVDALLEFVERRLPEAPLRAEMVDLAMRYLKAIGS